jgi:hypothetical protein
MSERKVVDATNHIPKKRGNGILRREVWVDSAGRVSRYNLAYINHRVCSIDNGRVVGYDNAHGYHHRHLMGQVEPIEFSTYEDVEERFELDYLAMKEWK